MSDALRDKLARLVASWNDEPPWTRASPGVGVDLHAFDDVRTLVAHAERKPLGLLTEDVLVALRLPEPLCDFYRHLGEGEALAFGYLTCDGPAHAVRDNLAGDWTYLPHALWQIGSGANGDPIVVDLITLQVGFLDHQEVWTEPPVDPGKHLAMTPLDLGRFFHAAVRCAEPHGKRPAFPVDSHAASALARASVDFASLFPGP